MGMTMRAWTAAVSTTVLLLGAQVLPTIAQADPGVPPSPGATEQSAGTLPPPSDPETQDLGPGPYNVVYRARVDGVSRGATISYAMADDQVNTANPTMVPGRTFEATGVVSQMQKAGMQVSIQWPYSASLHCEILANDQIVAAADQFVAPRFTPQHNDPGYGVLSCGTVTNFPTGNTAPVDAPAPVEPAPAA
ncbi:hypothetical protein TUM20983_27580 [Mycobacterium antarcticum]|uniref:hypothetical protein n=1 Tax=unclassified Mycolicibacterium TaxID=2636767 RepID=UPI0023A0E9A7|nr:MULTISPECIES: hypothetical protein [unclassified Mycolicibacterium]GLP75648.1 hypothetical protein TUM20983_27580 [Mycolicibacterium sp. TUM20983]GLP84001.1 hypothetical protein TUM20984_54210 [Mycolicibacterium sp. TUM20984]